MLNLSVTFMRPYFLVPLALLLLAAQGNPPVAITYPTPDDMVAGKVTITGTTDVPGFASDQLDFAYASDTTDTWFPVGTSTQSEVDSPLAVWDTTAITDGDYILRLRVNLEDGTFEDVFVQIKVRNDAPIRTPTPVVTSTPDRLNIQLPTPFLVAASPTPTLTPRPTPTLLPINALSLNRSAIYLSLGRGALVIIGLFLFAGLILRFRRY